MDNIQYWYPVLLFASVVMVMREGVKATLFAGIAANRGSFTLRYGYWAHFTVTAGLIVASLLLGPEYF